MDAASLLAPLAAEPSRAALLFDVDGTLAPIVARPELARVPDATRAELARLARRYRMVACLSGRPGVQAAELIGVAGIRYVGNHGLELDPRAETIEAEVARFRDAVDGLWPVEDKKLSLSFHFREAADEAAARELLASVAAQATAAGLEARWGRKVLEIRPVSAVDKGAAVQMLVREAGVSRALYAGDDSTDLDAFRGLSEAGLDCAVRIAVASPEAAPALLEASDLVVDGPAELLALLRML